MRQDVPFDLNGAIVSPGSNNRRLGGDIHETSSATWWDYVFTIRGDNPVLPFLGMDDGFAHGGAQTTLLIRFKDWCPSVQP